LVIALVALTAMTCVLVGPAVGSAVAAAPEDNLAPEVVGTPAVGERLVCAAGSWSGGVERFEYEWLREGVVISEEGNQYTVKSEDRGYSISCIVWAINGEGEEYEESSNSLFIPGEHPTAPQNKEPPKVEPGTSPTKVKEKLTCSQGTWSGSPAPTFTYQWLRAKASIESATKNTYEVVEADEGHSLSCKVTATNSAGSTPQISSNEVLVSAKPPEDTEEPKVLGTPEPEVGESLTCSPGTWKGGPTFTYQWLREGVSIESATAGTYIVQQADELHSLSCEVTATNGAGSKKVKSSNSLHVRGSKPVNTALPTVEGEAKVGKTLTCSPGTWSGDPAPTFAFVWLLEGGSVGLEKTYKVASADKGHSLSCEVTATNSEGFAKKTSAAVVVPAGEGGKKPEIEAPHISGEPAINATLTCSTSHPPSGEPTPTVTYQWLRDGADIPSATKNSYTVVEADLGHSLSCEVTATNSEGNATAGSTSVHVPGHKPTNTAAPEVSGNPEPEVGETLTCSQGSWSGEPTPTTFMYQWLREGASIKSATSNSYVVKAEDSGHLLSCEVTAGNTEGVSSPEPSSNSVHVPGSQPIPPPGGPQVLGGPEPKVGTKLTCSPGQWGGAPEPTYTYQWLLDGTSVPLATKNSYEVVEADEGRSLSCRVTATNSEGSESATSTSVPVPGSPPIPTEPPQVYGSPIVGETLTCSRGTWIGKPSPSFTYQWMLDGVEIPSATSGSYMVELAEEGQTLACEVTATNSEGTEYARSDGVEISTGTTPKLESKLDPIYKSLTSSDPPPKATAAEILAALGSQLTRAQSGGRSLLKHGTYGFSFAAPSAGTLELFWYEVPKGAHVSAKSKPILVAQATESFAGATAKTVKLALTSAGRRLIRRSKHIKLTAKGVFVQAGSASVTWLKTFLLSV
jgi:hypothetical protein